MDTEKLIEETTQALERCVMQCMEHDCCLGSSHDTINDDPRAILRSAFAEVRGAALMEAAKITKGLSGVATGAILALIPAERKEPTE